MSNRFERKLLNIHTTSRCTLKCKKCGWSFPKYPKPLEADLEKTLNGIRKTFEIYDFIQEVRFGGAEGFLYPHIETLMEAVSEYRDKFEYGIIITNGTYIPSKSIIRTMANLPYPFFVRIDNYGSLSKKYDELVSTLKENGIKLDERVYTGDKQAFGGWIDYGNYTKKNYTYTKLMNVYHNCLVYRTTSCLIDDNLTCCCYAIAGHILGKIPMNDREFIKLTDGRTADEIRHEIMKWEEAPFAACSYCNGFDVENAIRIPAAEQIIE